MAPPPISYAANYKFWWALIALNFKYYIFEFEWNYLLYGAMLSYLVRLLINYKRLGALTKEYWQICFLLLGLFFFAVYLPWGEHTRRYLVISDYCFALFIGMELGNFTCRFSIKNAIVLLIAVFLGYASCGATRLILKEIYQPSKSKGAVYALQWFAKQAKPNSRVLVLEFEQELLHSIVKYTQDFFARKDITVYSLSPFAADYQKSGFNVVAIDKISDEVLAKTDYIFWHHRGERAQMEQFHQYLFTQLMQSPYQLILKNIYDDTEKKGAVTSEGTEIWQFNR